jgi:N-methylhydantoinase B
MPAAVALRGQTDYRLADVMFGALGKVLPHKVFAAGEGGTSHIRIAGDRPEGGRFIFMDVIQGTWGARPDRDGVDGVGNIISNLSNTPVEVIEAEFPLRIQRYALAEDSGGAGRYRGGLGVVRQIELLADQADLQVRTDRQKFPPFGLAGGHKGRGARFVLNPDGEIEELPTKTNRVLKRGDVIRHDQASGGGYGDPLERDPEAVRADVLDDKVAVESAASVYGVALEGPRFDVDAALTAAERERLRGEQAAQA